MGKPYASADSRLLASVLAGSWRTEPPAAELSEAGLEGISQALMASGAGALAWRKVRRSALSATPSARDLQQTSRLQTLRAAVREGEIERLFALLHSAGVEAVLVKGLAASSAYPEAGLRPEGDIDLCVRTKHYRRAEELLAGEVGRGLCVDLHEGFGSLVDGSEEELYERSQVLKVGAARVRVLCAEDHLRLLCFHLLRHGAWRPLWLCDVAAALETRGEAFDWGRALGVCRRRANWVTSVLGLAHALLGASVDDTPAADAAGCLPRWLVPSVLRRWERPFPLEQPPHRYAAPLASYLRSPRGLFEDLRRRWPGPVEATVSVGWRFDGLPRWPFQLANCVTRAAHFVCGASSNLLQS